eukprot:scaffold183_cov112-Cylindrotheca_fusiformis.AAC.1
MHTCWVNEGKGSNLLKVKDVASTMINWAKGQGSSQSPSVAGTHSIDEEASTTSESDPKV